MLLINGLPVAIGELKTPVRNAISWLDGNEYFRIPVNTIYLDKYIVKVYCIYIRSIHKWKKFRECKITYC